VKSTKINLKSILSCPALLAILLKVWNYYGSQKESTINDQNVGDSPADVRMKA
jgi:hypothetical protein